MKPVSGNLLVESRYPQRGLMTAIPSTQMESGYSPNLLNMQIRDGVVFKRSGYHELINEALVGDVMAVVDFQLLNGTRHLVALTSRRQYRFDDGTDDWLDITTLGEAHTITALNQGAKTFTIAGDHTSEFPADGTAKVKASTGNDGFYTVVSSSFGGANTVITVVEAIPDSTVDGSIYQVIELTTVSGDFIDWTVGTDNSTHRLYMTNGRDTPRYWDGVTQEFSLWEPNYTDFVTCKTLRVFFSHLVMGNVTTSANEPKLIAWSDSAEFDEFEDGLAGALLIPDLSGIILRLEALRDRMIVWSEDSAAGLMFLGAPAVIGQEVILQGTRLVSPRAIVSFGSAQLFCSEENIYFFDGSPSIRPVGVNVRSIYKQSLSHEYGSRLFCFNDIAKRVIYVVVPTGASTATVLVLDYDIFDLGDFKWTRVNYTDTPLCLGFYKRRDFAAWNSPPDIPWSDDYAIWAEEGEQVDFPVRLLGSGSRVYVMDEVSGLDDGEEITATYETIDFVVPEQDLSMMARWLEFEADMAGTEVQVSYSTDHGSSWTVIATQTLTGTFSVYSLPMDFTARHVRFRLESSSYFSLRWLRAWMRPASNR